MARSKQTLLQITSAVLFNFQAKASALITPRKPPRLRRLSVRHTGNDKLYSNETCNTERWCKISCLRPAVAVALSALILVGTAGPVCSGALPLVSDGDGSGNKQQLEWNLSNGVVKLSDPLLSFPSMKLVSPRFLGSGGGGAVFGYTVESSDGTEGEEKNAKEVAVKVSWVRSASSVEKECDVLKVLERNGVRGVERCLCKARYDIKGTDGEEWRRIMIAMEPVLDDAVASIGGVDEKVQPHSVRCVLRTMVDMLRAGVVTTDIQPLISRETGEVLFIDMTEAVVMSRPEPSFLDMALASSFCSEMISLIPEKLHGVASEELLRQLTETELIKGHNLTPEVLDLLRDQTSLFESQELLDFIDGQIGPYTSLS